MNPYLLRFITIFIPAFATSILAARIGIDYRRGLISGKPNIVSLACSVACWVFFLIALTVQKPIHDAIESGKAFMDVGPWTPKNQVRDTLVLGLLVPMYVQILGVSFARLSLLAKYYSIWNRVERTRKATLGFATALQIMVLTGLLFQSSLYCWPIRKIWDPFTHGFCEPVTSPSSVVLYTLGGITADLVLMTLALFMLRSSFQGIFLLAMLFMMSLGVVTISTTIGRATVMVKLHREYQKYEFNSGTKEMAVVLNFVEFGTALVVGCLPSFKSMYQAWREQKREDKKRKREIDATYTRDAGAATPEEFDEISFNSILASLPPDETTPVCRQGQTKTLENSQETLVNPSTGSKFSLKSTVRSFAR